MRCCIHHTLQSRSPCGHATRAGSQWGNEQSYTHDQPQALGHYCPPQSPLRLDRGWKEALSCRVCCGRDWKELHLAWVRIAPSACVSLLQAGGLQTKLRSPTIHNHLRLPWGLSTSKSCCDSSQNTSCVFSWLWDPCARAIAIRWSDLSGMLHPEPAVKVPEATETLVYYSSPQLRSLHVLLVLAQPCFMHFPLALHQRLPGLELQEREDKSEPM